MNVKKKKIIFPDLKTKQDSRSQEILKYNFIKLSINRCYQLAKFIYNFSWPFNSFLSDPTYKKHEHCNDMAFFVFYWTCRVWCLTLFLPCLWCAYVDHISATNTYSQQRVHASYFMYIPLHLLNSHNFLKYLSYTLHSPNSHNFLESLSYQHQIWTW